MMTRTTMPPDDFLSRIASILTGERCDVFLRNPGPRAFGLSYTLPAGRFGIAIDPGLAPLDQYDTLLHECGHIAQGHVRRSTRTGNSAGAAREAAQTIAAITITGIETASDFDQELSADALAFLWDSQAETLTGEPKTDCQDFQIRLKTLEDLYEHQNYQKRIARFNHRAFD